LGLTPVAIAWVLINAHRYNEAIQEARNVLAVKPDDASTLGINLAWALILNHQAAEAIPVLEKSVSLTHRSPGVLGTLVWAYTQAGRRSDAVWLVEELKKRQQTGYVPAAAFVFSYLGLGENDEAFAWFDRACKEQSNILKYLKVFPPFDSLRADSRFNDLIRRVGLD
jgi:Flp pilus assembly protein TadD